MKKKKTNKKVKIDKFDLFVMLTTMFTLGMLVQKIATNGLAWMSTIGYLG